MGKTLKKRIIIILGIIGIVWAFNVPSFGDRFMLFCMLGINPATNKPFSPSILTLILVSLFLVSFELLFHKYVARLVRYIIKGPAPLALPLDDAQNATTTPIKVVRSADTVAQVIVQEHNHAPKPVKKKYTLPPVITRNLRVLKKKITTLYHKIPGKMVLDVALKVATRTARLCRVSARITGRFIHKIWIAVYAFAVRHWPDIKQGFYAVVALAIIVVLGTVQLGIKLWHWFKPYGQQFDVRIARMLHANDRTSFMLVLGKEFAVFSRSAWRLWTELYDKIAAYARQLRGKYLRDDE